MSAHDALRWCLVQIRYKTGRKLDRERLDDPHWFTWIELEARGLMARGHELSAAIGEALKRSRTYEKCPLVVKEEPQWDTM